MRHMHSRTLLRIARFTCAALALASTAPAAPATAPATKRATATFAMGCFWCAETAFEGKPGVLDAVSGYTGGKEQYPTYEQVSRHRTGHYEALQVTYDPARISYEGLLDLFWHNIDPTQADGQFCDRGNQYRAAIFVANDAERAAAQASKRAFEKSKAFKQPTMVSILPAARFWVAEDYHQDYYKKSPDQYRAYRLSCGRDARLKALYGDKAGKSAGH